MSAPSVAPLPEPKSKLWLWILAGVSLLGVGMVAGVLLGKQLYPTPQIPLTPTPISRPIPIPDPTTNWKTYSNGNYFYEIKYPQDWTTISSIQKGEKTEPIGLHGSELKGKVVDIHNNYPNNRVQPFLQIEAQVQIDFADFEARKPSWKGEQITFLGKPAVKSVIQFNGEPSLNLLPGIAYNLLVYSLENQMTYEIICNENRPANNGFCDRILSTFRFLDQSQNGSCSVDSDCGVNVCDCKSDLKSNLKPQDLACTRYCPGTPKCVNNRCVLTQ